MTKMIKVHQALGLTDDEVKELTADILKKTEGTTTVVDALGSIKDAYDPKAVFIGMRMMQLLAINEGIHKQIKEHAFVEAFGSQQNAEMN